MAVRFELSEEQQLAQEALVRKWTEKLGYPPSASDDLGYEPITQPMSNTMDMISAEEIKALLYGSHGGFNLKRPDIAQLDDIGRISVDMKTVRKVEEAIRTLQTLLDQAAEAIELAKEWVNELREQNDDVIPSVGDILDMEKIDKILAAIQPYLSTGDTNDAL